MVMIINKAKAQAVGASRAITTPAINKLTLRGGKVAVDIEGRRLALPSTVHHTTVVTQHGHVLLAVTGKGEPCCILLRPNVTSERISSVNGETATTKVDDSAHEMVADLRRRFGTPSTTIRASGSNDDPSVSSALDRLSKLVCASSLDDQEAASLRAASLLYGTPFQVQVWRAMSNVPAGQTQSYAELSKAAGGSGGQGARATAQACGANPLTLLFPCHRIVAANGKTGGYHWGYKVKEAILATERRQVVTA